MDYQPLSTGADSRLQTAIYYVSLIPDGASLLELAAKTNAELLDDVNGQLNATSLGAKAVFFSHTTGKIRSIVLIKPTLNALDKATVLLHELHHLFQEFKYNAIDTGLTAANKAAPLLTIALQRIREGATWAFTAKKTDELRKATGLPFPLAMDPRLNYKELFHSFQTSETAQA